MDKQKLFNYKFNYFNFVEKKDKRSDIQTLRPSSRKQLYT